jgi:hypothetical protein
MPSQTAKTTHEPDETITRGTGNVFADLGYPDAEERQTKLGLAHAINAVIARRRLTQVAEAVRLGVNQSNPSYSPHSRDSLTGMVQTPGIA